VYEKWLLDERAELVFPKLIWTNLAELSPGRQAWIAFEGRPVPQGRLKIGLDPILDNLQPSLRDLITLHDVPRTVYCVIQMDAYPPKNDRVPHICPFWQMWDSPDLDP
jgi:hypothetical protein